MKLSEESLFWAINHLNKFGDTDLFPNPLELKIIADNKDDIVSKLKDIDLSNYTFGSARRFVVPKDKISYRTATQLDPIDSIFLTAIIYEYGQLIENKRITIGENKVFSYRFSPQDDYALYNPDVSWVNFWRNCKRKSRKYKYAVYLDIADFYNQIYHHTIENQLIEVSFPNQITKWLLGLFESVTAKVSRGIPVGSHATHLIAELVMIAIDNSMILKGFDFCRYVDDIVIFCETEEEATIIIYKMADLLDKQQRLMLQKQKTKIYDDMTIFYTHCNDMIQDQPINNQEKEILKIMRRKGAGRNPYENISIKDLNDEDLKHFTTEIIENIFNEYLNGNDANYTRLRWFLRRLSQIGIPAGVNFCIQNTQKMIPALSDVCHYLISASDNYQLDWKIQGDLVIDRLDSDIIKSSEYFQLSLLNLFSKNKDLNHISTLINMYQNASPSLRRKIILAAYTNSSISWIRELKESYKTMDIWSQRSFIISISCLPKDEKKFFLGTITNDDILNDILKQWARNT
jgi:hypothetical protein